MMNTDSVQRTRVELGTVQETLLIPLYYRAAESRRPDAIIQDSFACKITEKLEYDFRKFDPHWNIQMDVAIRTEIFDEILINFLKERPRATVLNLGAGLDARCLRLDNQRLKCFNIDLPDSIELRNLFFPNQARHTNIAANVFDFGWMDQVDLGSEASSSVIALAEGLFCYCTESQIKSLLGEMSQRWPGCQLAFQSLCPALVGRAKTVGAVNQTQAEFRWGVKWGKELLRWNPKYQLVGEYYFVDRHRERWGVIGRRLWNPFVRRWFRQVMKITVLRL
jgi:O-methyltransferase involved in polyketide biosynthesis